MSFKLFLLNAAIYLAGVGFFLVMIAEPFTMDTYFSDNSLLPGLANREFSLGVDADYYLVTLDKLGNLPPSAQHDTTKQHVGSPYSSPSLANSHKVTNFIKRELDHFGLEVYEQNFASSHNGVQFNGSNIYAIIRGERSANSEAVVLCAPYQRASPSSSDDKGDTLPSVALSLALAKYFSTKSYWAKDVIILFVDHREVGTAAWLDSYHDVNFKSDLHYDGLHYDSLPSRSGPLQAAIVLELYGPELTRLNIKIQGAYGQLPNLDLFNLVVEIAPRESVTPYFHDKSFPFDLSLQEHYIHHFETALSFIKSQATMRADGLHGLFLSHAAQALTLEGPAHKSAASTGRARAGVLTSSLLNVGRLVEGIFRSLNNLTERFNRSYYFYIILSLRRFTSIAYYMIAFGLMVAPVLNKALAIYLSEADKRTFIGKRTFLLLASALILSLLSTFNISTALLAALVSVPALILI